MVYRLHLNSYRELCQCEPALSGPGEEVPLVYGAVLPACDLEGQSHEYFILPETSVVLSPGDHSQVLGKNIT